MTIEAVIFDFGCVLSLPQSARALQDLADKICLPLNELEKLYWEFRQPYDAGLISGPEYWKRVSEKGQCGVDDKTVQELIDIDNKSWAHENEPMSTFAREIRESGIRTALLSNMPPDFRDFLPIGVRWLPPFDHRTLSCELGVTKPHERIYEHCLNGLRTIAADHVVFIDDREDNIQAAQAAGWRVIHFRENQQALNEVKAML